VVISIFSFHFHEVRTILHLHLILRHYNLHHLFWTYQWALNLLLATINLDQFSLKVWFDLFPLGDGLVSLNGIRGTRFTFLVQHLPLHIFSRYTAQRIWCRIWYIRSFWLICLYFSSRSQVYNWRSIHVYKVWCYYHLHGPSDHWGYWFLCSTHSQHTECFYIPLSSSYWACRSVFYEIYQSALVGHSLDRWLWCPLPIRNWMVR